tara:strand:+ start:1925 stop:3121 length:1197 start_codon:yes stop_codon:yes gene_type:complete
MIIKTLMDTDLYKLTMLNFFHKKYPDYNAQYEYKCRSEHKHFLTEDKYVDEINYQLDRLCELRFTIQELCYLNEFIYFDDDFISFLENFQLQRKNIFVGVNSDGLSIIAKGNITNVMMFEIYVLKIVSEVYTSLNYGEKESDLGMQRLEQKVNLVNAYVDNYNEDFSFTDFGSRRAFSADHHEKVVKYLSDNCKGFNGTSNLRLAMKYDLTVVGTHAHEFQSFFQCCYALKISVGVALEQWKEMYSPYLLTALTDTLGVDRFCGIFFTDRNLVRGYESLRHDSGDPFAFVDKIVNCYNQVKHHDVKAIDKNIVFSDGLDFLKAFKLADYCIGKIKSGFGIGTHLTFDIPNVAPVQSVMKLTFAGKGKLKPVCKISDNPIKAVGGTKAYVEQVKRDLML